MLSLLNPNDENQAFPDVALALTEPNGLLAAGGCLSPRRLVNAYRQGISRGLPRASLSSGGRPTPAW